MPICGKIIEKIIFDKVYSFSNSNNLISKRQSGFRPNDSTIYQLISITSRIYKSFENYDETRAVFPDISKAFDKVWHDGVIHKFVEKSKSLSATIKKALLPQFSSVSEKENKKSTNTEQGIAKEIAQSQKLIDIAKSRNISTAEILEFDLLQSSPLFDGDFPPKPSKSALVTELESEKSSNEMQFN